MAISIQERTRHSQLTIAPITNVEYFLRKVKRCKPGDWIWISGIYGQDPVRFISFDGGHLFKYERFENAPVTHTSFYYEIIRKATKKEILEIIAHYRSLVNFYDNKC